MSEPLRENVPRREFLRTGFAAVGAFMLAASPRRVFPSFDDLAARAPWTPLHASCPIRKIPANTLTVAIDGLPFAPTWFGDNFPSGGFPFHSPEDPPSWAQLDERVDVAIVGGGLSGLATAYNMRGRDWVLFDLRDRFGGNAMGEQWNRMPYSLGSAYFMVPDKESELDLLYRDLGVYELARIDAGDGFRVEYADVLLSDLCQDCTPDEIAAMKLYRAAVTDYANNNYPEIPWSDPDMQAFVQLLDTQSFHMSVDTACGGVTPPLLAKALQAYCYSSFGVGWDELSAAAGWNFVAAEEFGRLVLPGGNAGLATLYWKELASVAPRSNGRDRLRAGCLATNVRLEKEGVSLSWRDATGRVRTLGAKHLVYAGSKHIFRHMMPELATIDPEKYEALHQTPTVPYVVVNVLLNRNVPERFYDIFSIHDAQFPMYDESFETDRRITDVLDGTFAIATPHPSADVLTMYWPLPWHTARFTIIQPESFGEYAALAAPQIRRLLTLVGVTASDVAQIRMARWGHAMPYARPGAYAGNLCETLRRPVADRIWFANQDNWLLPAVETCLAEAAWVAANVPS